LISNKRFAFLNSNKRWCYYSFGYTSTKVGYNSKCISWSSSGSMFDFPEEYSIDYDVF
jgi:hypothetical protein